MNREPTDPTKTAQLTACVTRRIALRVLALHAGLVSLGVFASGMSAAAIPSADCKFYCKNKERRKARQRCYDRCNSAIERCWATPECVAEQVCGHARCMTICTSDAECLPGSHCQDGACVRI